MSIDRRVAVPALAALAVSVLGVSVALLGSDPTHPPKVLELSSGQVAKDAALGAPTVTGEEGGYTLVGTLPSGRPDDTRVWTLPTGPASTARVQALATALDVGTPQRDGAGWRAQGLVVSGDSGQAWWYSACASDSVVSSDGRVDCAVAVPGGTSGSGSTGSGTVTAEPAPPPDPGDDFTVGPTPDDPAPRPSEPAASPVPVPVPEATVTSAARPVLQSLGLSLSDAVVDTSPYGGSVTVPAAVDGLQAYGFTTRVDVSADGKVTGGNGWLATPDRGDAYPLITAQEAFDNLPPRVVAMLCPIGPDGQGCLPPAPTEVTGAHLGLSLQPMRDGSQLLVPSWLFTVKGWTEPVPVVAVQEKFLSTGEEPPPTGKPDAS